MSTEKQFDPEDLSQDSVQRRSQLRNLQAAKAVNVDTGNVGKREHGINARIENGLVGDIDPVRIAKRETPVHRTMVNMAGAGYTNREIAAFTGYSPATVATAIKQPHAREYLINEAKKTVQDEIRELLECQAIPSINKLIEVRDSATARHSDVLTASNAILDRFLGKPTQPIVTNEKPADQLSDDELKSRANAILSRFSGLEGAPITPAS